MNNTILEKLKELKLNGAAQAYAALLEEPSLSDGLSTDELMLQLLESEANLRFANRQKCLIRQAAIPLPAMLKDVIYSDERGADLRQNLSQLATLDFIRNGQNVTIFGPTATGKSFLACAIARKACANGFSTTYIGTKELIEDMKLKVGTAGYVNKRRSLKGRALLVLDDFSLTLYDNNDQAILFDVLNDRYGKKSTIIVSQKTPVVWNQEMNGTTLAQSIVSRASSNNFSLVLKGKSMRSRLRFDSEKDSLPEDLPDSGSVAESVAGNCNSYRSDDIQTQLPKHMKEINDE